MYQDDFNEVQYVIFIISGSEPKKYKRNVKTVPDIEPDKVLSSL